MMNGNIICLDGPDGVGKSSQEQVLRDIRKEKSEAHVEWLVDLLERVDEEGLTWKNLRRIGKDLFEHGFKHGVEAKSKYEEKQDGGSGG